VRADRHIRTDVDVVRFTVQMLPSPALLTHLCPPVRLAIISDIHSNLEALDRTFQTIDEANVDAIYCLGDIVGYNADPAACVDLVRERCDAVVLDNHDAAVAQKTDVNFLPPDGQEAARHNREQLSAAQRDYLADLPLTHTTGNCTFVHATPDAPMSWKRLTAYPAAQAQFDHFDTDICFIGHTHSPAVMADSLGIFRVRSGHRYLINVGSVGQPRDGNPKLSFGLFDTETFDYENVRLDYDVAAAARKIRNADRLPNSLADRLEEGR
jgi:predicted phosphodiesterase